jgi:hypothetical protein
MRERRRATTADLRQAIDCLPRATRVAMLEGIRSNEIIVGAYSEDGGICPMLAAHRAGGRTNFIAFAKAWDRFGFRDTRGALGFQSARRHEARRATERELLVLQTHLEASLLEDEGPSPGLADAIREHDRLVGERRVRAEKARPGDRYRHRELRSRLGWAWTRIVRTHDDYEEILERLAAEQDSLRHLGDDRGHARAT